MQSFKGGDSFFYCLPVGQDIYLCSSKVAITDVGILSSWLERLMALQTFVADNLIDRQFNL